MVNPVVIAFFTDVLASLCSQVGLILQKLAHHHQEKSQSVHVNNAQNTPRNAKNSSVADLSEDEDVTRDKDETSKAYCSWRFALGFFFMIMGTLIHVMVLPFLDLTLIAVNAVVGIIFSVLLSIIILGEQIVPKYDISGLIFISMGCSGIVVFANKNEQTFTGQQTVDLLLSAKTLIFVSSCFAFFFINQLVVHRFAQKLREYENAVDVYQGDVQAESVFQASLQDEETRQNQRVRMILAPRERVNSASEETK